MYGLTMNRSISLSGHPLVINKIKISKRFTFICFLPITNYSKILRPKNWKHFCIGFFLISTKFKSKRIEHLQDQGFISSELYYSTRTHYVTKRF